MKLLNEMTLDELKQELTRINYEVELADDPRKLWGWGAKVQERIEQLEELLDCVAG